MAAKKPAPKKPAPKKPRPKKAQATTEVVNHGGRPTALTHEVQERIIQAVRGGSYLDDAANYAGIAERTLYRWLAKGRDAINAEELGYELTEQERLYGQFCQALLKARADATIRNLTLIQNAAQSGSWQAAAWFLERTNPRKWGRHETFEIEGVDRDTPQNRTDIALMLDERIARMRERASAIIETTGQPIDPPDTADTPAPNLKIAK